MFRFPNGAGGFTQRPHLISILFIDSLLAPGHQTIEGEWVGRERERFEDLGDITGQLCLSPKSSGITVSTSWSNIVRLPTTWQITRGLTSGEEWSDRPCVLGINMMTN